MNIWILTVVVATTNLLGRIEINALSIPYKTAETCLKYRQKALDKFEGKYSFVHAECEKKELQEK